MVNPLAFFLVLAGSIVATAGSIFLKKGSRQLVLNLSALRNRELVLGVLLYAISSVMYITSLRLGDLAIIYPLTSMTYIFIALASAKFLNEKLTKFKVIGICLIVAGVLAITR